MSVIGLRSNTIDRSDKYFFMCLANEDIKRNGRYEAGDHLATLISGSRDIMVMSTLCAQVYGSTHSSFRVAYLKNDIPSVTNAGDIDITDMTPFISELDFDTYRYSDIVWLPTTRQLKMIYSGGVEVDILENLKQIIYFIQLEAKRGRFFETEEQAWMAYVMQRVYNKIWTGTEWEIIKSGD